MFCFVFVFQFLEDDINGHQEMFASLNENGQLIMAEMETGDVLTAVQAKLDDMNDRWQSLNVRTLDIRDRLEDTGTEWRQLLMDLQEIIDWIARADQELTLQQPIGGDLESVQHQNENHQVTTRVVPISVSTKPTAHRPSLCRLACLLDLLPFAAILRHRFLKVILFLSS